MNKTSLLGTTLLTRIARRFWRCTAVTLMVSTLLPTPASAANHEWRPKARILASGAVVFDTVTVTGTSINWGAGSWDSAFNEVPVTTATNGWSLAIAISQAKTAAINLANACKNPALSSHAKSTTSQNDVVDRWLAANQPAPDSLTAPDASKACNGG